ncbi:MAG: PQQ-binding-like beta-propeller repeat protein [Sedimentisphaerales bacterium]|nr:PQQ-binding-like beta-propeller repeat protein [Sedimentisphaerales bacterium]
MIVERLCQQCLAILLLVVPASWGQAPWPQFRGPWGNGLASAPGTQPLGLPIHWSEKQNIRWKTAIPHRGWSTPVVMDGQVWLTTATADGHDFFVVCVDADSGQIRLQEKLFHADHPEPLGNPLNCYASPSPTIEPGRVYVHFGSYGTAALDTQTGEVLWKRSDLPCRHYRGPGSSLLLFENLLIVTMDGVDVQYLVALDKKTGRTIWKTDRTAQWDDLDADGKPKDEGDLRKAYSTPLLVTVGTSTQMLSVGAKAVYGYDPASGREIWKIATPAFSGAASPVYGHGIAYMITGFGRTELLAIRLDGGASVTDASIVWRTSRMVPQTPSPVLVDDLLFMVNEAGVLTCLEAASGKQLWRERVKGDFAASLLYADGRVYCFSRDGVTTVLRAARDYDVLAMNTLDSGFMASPAVSGKTLFLRTKEHLYRIEFTQ